MSAAWSQTGDAVFIPAGTVHTLGDVVVFEVQENSDVTFRLYDWDRVDPETASGGLWKWIGRLPVSILTRLRPV